MGLGDGRARPMLMIAEACQVGLAEGAQPRLLVVVDSGGRPIRNVAQAQSIVITMVVIMK